MRYLPLLFLVFLTSVYLYILTMTSTVFSTTEFTSGCINSGGGIISHNNDVACAMPDGRLVTRK